MGNADAYEAWVEDKAQGETGGGFAPASLPEWLFDFQREHPAVVRTERPGGSVEWYNPSVPRAVNGTYHVGAVQPGLAPPDDAFTAAELWGCSHEPDCETPEACGVRGAREGRTLTPFVDAIGGLAAVLPSTDGGAEKTGADD